MSGEPPKGFVKAKNNPFWFHPDPRKKQFPKDRFWFIDAIWAPESGVREDKP